VHVRWDVDVAGMRREVSSFCANARSYREGRTLIVSWAVEAVCWRRTRGRKLLDSEGVHPNNESDDVAFHGMF
jgi:hypothetical protein